MADAAEQGGANGAPSARAHDDEIVPTFFDPTDQRRQDRLSGQHGGHRPVLRHPVARGGGLNTLSGAPRRITELAELEGLAQPTLTLLVQTLEQRGWVKRRRPTDDGRVVLVSLTEAGKATLEEFRMQFGAALRAHMDAMPDEQIAALDTATEALGSLVRVLQSPTRK